MLGRLPRLHLVTLATVSVVVFLGAGLWLGLLSGVPVTVPVGAGLGALVGLAFVWMLVHDSRDATPPARAVRRH